MYNYQILIILKIQNTIYSLKYGIYNIFHLFIELQAGGKGKGGKGGKVGSGKSKKAPQSRSIKAGLQVNFIKKIIYLSIDFSFLLVEFIDS